MFGSLVDSYQRFIDYNNEYGTIEAIMSQGTIEDDILVTHDGFRVLGKPIPKGIEEVEALLSL